MLQYLLWQGSKVQKYKNKVQSLADWFHTSEFEWVSLSLLSPPSLSLSLFLFLFLSLFLSSLSSLSIYLSLSLSLNLSLTPRPSNTQTHTITHTHSITHTHTHSIMHNHTNIDGPYKRLLSFPEWWSWRGNLFLAGEQNLPNLIIKHGKNFSPENKVSKK